MYARLRLLFHNIKCLTKTQMSQLWSYTTVIRQPYWISLTPNLNSTGISKRELPIFLIIKYFNIIIVFYHLKSENVEFSNQVNLDNVPMWVGLSKNNHYFRWYELNSGCGRDPQLHIVFHNWSTWRRGFLQKWAYIFYSDKAYITLIVQQQINIINIIKE